MHSMCNWCGLPIHLKIFRILAYQVASSVKNLAQYVFDTLKSKCKKFVFYSAAMKKSIDATDTVQVAVFISGVDRNFTIAEE